MLLPESQKSAGFLTNAHVVPGTNRMPAIVMETVVHGNSSGLEFNNANSLSERQLRSIHANGLFDFGAVD